MDPSHSRFSLNLLQGGYSYTQKNFTSDDSFNNVYTMDFFHWSTQVRWRIPFLLSSIQRCLYQAALPCQIIGDSSSQEKYFTDLHFTAFCLSISTGLGPWSPWSLQQQSRFYRSAFFWDMIDLIEMDPSLTYIYTSSPRLRHPPQALMCSWISSSTQQLFLQWRGLLRCRRSFYTRSFSFT